MSLDEKQVVKVKTKRLLASASGELRAEVLGFETEE